MVPSLSVLESWVLALPARPGWGRVGPENVSAASWWFGGERGPFFGGLQSQGISPGPGLSTAHGEGKIYQRKSQLPMSPTPCPPIPIPLPHSTQDSAPRTLHPAWRQEAPSSGTAHGHDTGLVGRSWWLWRSLHPAGRWSVHRQQWVCVPGRQTLASSISRKSLCMGTLPCSLTL